MLTGFKTAPEADAAAHAVLFDLLNEGGAHVEPHMRRFAPEEIVALEGDKVEVLYQVIDGVVKLYKSTPDGRRQIVRFLYPQQWFCGILWDRHRYTAEAVGPTILRAAPRRALAARLHTDPRVASLALRIADRSLQLAENQMLVLGCKDASGKVASFILDLAHAHYKVASQGDEERTPPEIVIPMKRADIADYLGLTIETVCRKMSDFRRASLIEMVTSSRIRLLNENGLRAVAEGRCGPLH